jgi:hypothetical protein
VLFGQRAGGAIQVGEVACNVQEFVCGTPATGQATRLTFRQRLVLRQLDQLDDVMKRLTNVTGKPEEQILGHNCLIGEKCKVLTNDLLSLRA